MILGPAVFEIVDIFCNLQSCCLLCWAIVAGFLSFGILFPGDSLLPVENVSQPCGPAGNAHSDHSHYVS